MHGIIFETMDLAYPLLAAIFRWTRFAELPRKKRVAAFGAARFTAPNPIGGPS
jgi:hypothetical protein